MKKGFDRVFVNLEKSYENAPKFLEKNGISCMRRYLPMLRVHVSMINHFPLLVNLHHW